MASRNENRRVTPSMSGKGTRGRAPAFTAENAAEMGKRGGKASVKARQEKKAIRELAQAVLDAKVKDPEVNRRMKELGLIMNRADVRASFAVAILGNMADIAISSQKESIKAAETLIRIASGEIGLTPGGLPDDGESGGVVLMPGVNTSLLGEPLDRSPVSGEEAGAEDDSQTNGGGS